MIYGFAKQSGGHVAIDSELDVGTTVTLFLPRAAAEVAAEPEKSSPEIQKGDGQTVLLIEDEPDVRSMMARMLKGLGYGLIEAKDAAAAQAIVNRGESFDLVLSDVVLPGGESGPDFVDRLRARNPDLKVVFMSGYSAEVMREHDLPGIGAVLLQKPFQRARLAEALKNVLEAR
jgi:CheY-like chemotaxis protein